MPRIDPIQLLNCLSVLLSPKGGVKSRDEVERLAGLMTKFSKKLVSKCIYIQILKCTETDLLGMFMGAGGWRLVHTWLMEGMTANNWPLVRELLELLLLCPVGIERLKTNNCPKLVKELSKDEIHLEIRALASKLVEQWLKTVKGEEVVPIQVTDIQQIITKAEVVNNTEHKKVVQSETVSIVENPVTITEAVDLDTSSESVIYNTENVSEANVKDDEDEEEEEEEEEEPDKETLPILKITLKNGKQIISHVDDDDKKSSDDSSDQYREKSKDKHKSRNREKSHDRSSSTKSSSSKHSSKSSSSEKRKSNSKSSSSSSKHSSKEKSSRDKERHSSHSSKSKDSSSSEKKSSSSSKSKDRSSRQDKERSKDKDYKVKDAKDGSHKSVDKLQKSEDKAHKSEDKPQSPSIQKLGKIPKLSDVKREKPSISIEVRKPDEPKPKTVKTFNSKFRKHGLEEEIKPPPSRASLLNKKPPPVIPPTVSIPKRPSPVHNETPPEKKPKIIESIEKPGAIKLIPPKPKPMVLQESDMFMDALNASATNKKEPKKRKRRTSGSKDGNAPNEGSPPHTPTTPSSPNSENKSVPPRFYQDTLETEDNKDKLNERKNDVLEKTDQADSDDKEMTENVGIPEPPHTLTVNGLKGVLCYHKRKGPKKSIKWKPDSELEEIQYFELDETERVNVTKTFTDMKHLERIHEREAFQKARNLINDDVMEEKTIWRALILIDTEGQIHVEYGKNSKERDIQAVRQKGTLQPLYFHKSMIPDSPFEPDPETHVYSEPCIIPLDDVTGNQDNISDFRNMPWPEPKGNAPSSSSSNVNVQAMFATNITQFPNTFPPVQFPGVPPVFQGPPMVPGDWPNGVPPQMIPNGMPAPMTASNMPPGSIPPGAMPPAMMMPPENMMMGPEMFGGPNPMFTAPPDGFNLQQNMFPMDYNIPGPQAPPGPDGFAGPGNFRGPMRGRGVGGHWRGKVAGGWDGNQRGRGGTFPRGGRKTVCIYFQRKGSCRQGDNCTFLHPGVNCPF